MKIDKKELQEYNDEVTQITTLINDVINDIANYHKGNNNAYNDDKFINYSAFYNNIYFLTINNDGSYILDFNNIDESLIDDFNDEYGCSVEILDIEQMEVLIHNYFVKIYDEYIELLKDYDFDEVAKYDVDDLNIIFSDIADLDNIITNYTNKNLELIETL